MSDDELQWLYEAARWADGPIVEVGCWKGRSTHALLSGCRHTVYAVDHFLGSPEEREGPHREAVERDIKQDFLANVGHFPNLQLLHMHSEEAVEVMRSKRIGFVFLDGSHAENDVEADIRRWGNLTLMLCGHDCDWPAVRKAVDRLCPTVQRPAGSIWVRA